MKVISIHKKKNLENIDFNHRLYCKLTGYEYEKVYIDDPYMEKYLLILQKLQENEGSQLIFIDSDCFFRKNEKLPELKRDMYIQKYEDCIIDNFIIVKSNTETIKVFSDICYSIAEQQKGRSLNQKIKISYPEEKLLQYPYALEDFNAYLNVSLYSNQSAFLINNIFVVNTTILHRDQPTSYYFAEVLCSKKNFKREKKEKDYQCINPGKDNALVCLYTPEIENMGLVVEENLTLYCKYHDITLHMYRDTTESLKKNNIIGRWCKPHVLLENFSKHKYVAWIDSDIVIGKNYKIDFTGDISCYTDPVFPMNSGFMVFKTTNKNKKLMKELIEEFDKIDGDLSAERRGDQPIFTRKIQEFYPDYSFKSNLSGNSHPYIPRHLSPSDHSNMIHFMGFPNTFRYHVMDGFAQAFNKEME